MKRMMRCACCGSENIFENLGLSTRSYKGGVSYVCASMQGLEGEVELAIHVKVCGDCGYLMPYVESEAMVKLQKSVEALDLLSELGGNFKKHPLYKEFFELINAFYLIFSL